MMTRLPGGSLIWRGHWIGQDRKVYDHTSLVYALCASPRATSHSLCLACAGGAGASLPCRLPALIPSASPRRPPPRAAASVVTHSLAHPPTRPPACPPAGACCAAGRAAPPLQPLPLCDVPRAGAAAPAAGAAAARGAPQPRRVLGAAAVVRRAPGRGRAGPPPHARGACGTREGGAGAHSVVSRSGLCTLRSSRVEDPAL
jgi:hypothetical protein